MIKDFVLVIPARLESTRLPRKLLRKIEGISIIERTFNCAFNALGDRNKIIIATDSKLILEHCHLFGANVILTSKNCLTGTDRVAEISKIVEANQYINLQGDEPIFPVSDLTYFISEVTKNPDYIYTGITKIYKEEDYNNLSIPKMVFTNSKRLLYSSRAPIPCNKSGKFVTGFKHICVYAFNKTHLNAFTSLDNKTVFEFEEDLEINRFLELDMDVKCIPLEKGGKAVDTQEDLEKVSNLIRTNSEE